MSTNENIEYLRTYVRGTYDIQKLRVAIGNRITGNFKAKLGFKNIDNMSEQQPAQPKHSEAQLNALAVEYMVVQNCIRQVKLTMEIRKREIERQYESLKRLEAETFRLEAQSARVFKYLAPNEKTFILGYDDQGNYIQGE